MGDSRLKNITGRHYDTYEAYFRMMDIKGTGVVEAFDAVKFLRKSGLSDVVLSRVWELSDQKDTGRLDKVGFFTALKLVALAQIGEQASIANLLHELDNAPKCGDIPKKVWDSLNTINCIPVGTVDWSINPTDRQMYEQIYESLGPENGLISGNKVRGKLMESKLPIAILGRIWDLADQDKDGSLDKHEFSVAWHLVCVALSRKIVPDKLPPQLERPKADEFVAVFPDRISPPPVVPPLPTAIRKPSVTSLIDIGGPVPPILPLAPAPAVAPLPASEWVVTTMQKLRYDELFDEVDADHDGLATGFEIRGVFLNSGLHQKTLADIWGLCDTKVAGKLTKEQFALAMWLIERKKKENIDPPKVLEPNMIPPSLRRKVPPAGIPMPAAMPLIPDDPPQPTYQNAELQMVAEDIAKLAKERRQLELEVAQKDADIKIKSGEVRSLESELTTLTATLKQLEYQKGEAQKRLDDLRAQKQFLDTSIHTARTEICSINSEVDKIRDQCQKQEQVLKETETEVDLKRNELQKLKEEEQNLQKDCATSQSEVEQLSKNLQETQLEISQVKAMVSQLQETKRQMSDSLTACKDAIESDNFHALSDYMLNMEPGTVLTEAKLLLEGKKPEPEQKSNGFNTRFDVDFSNGFSNDTGFGSAGSKKFDDGFGASFEAKPDPFAPAVDPFAPKAGSAAAKEAAAADAFGSDPFAMLHAPTTASAAALAPSPLGRQPPSPLGRQPPSRPESPSPALPPKKAKQPPMRPPPPRPAAGPNLSKSPAAPAASDAFGGDSFSGGAAGGFANFADFDNKKLVPVNPFATLSQKNDKPADFSDDPFKNYRYEDVFNIEDPFAEGSTTIKETFIQDWVNSNTVFPETTQTIAPVAAPSPAPKTNEEFTLAFGPTALNKNKFTKFDKNFDDAQHKFNTVKPSKTSISAAFGDPFGDNNNTTATNKVTSSSSKASPFDDDDADDFLNDNFGSMKFDDNKFAAFGNNGNGNGGGGGFDELDNSKSLTVGGKGRGFAVKQQIQSNFDATTNRTISKQDFSQDEEFGEVLAEILERSKREK